MKGGRAGNAAAFAFGLLVGAAAWLARDVWHERRWAERGQVQVERFLKAEAEGWR